MEGCRFFACPGGGTHSFVRQRWRQFHWRSGRSRARQRHARGRVAMQHHATIILRDMVLGLQKLYVFNVLQLICLFVSLWYVCMCAHMNFTSSKHLARRESLLHDSMAQEKKASIPENKRQHKLSTRLSDNPSTGIR